MEAAQRYFLRRERRRVHRDFSDVQLGGRFYRVDRRYRGDRVEVRYDPFSTLETVLIYSLKEEYLGKGVLHNREEGEDTPPPPPGKPRYNYLDLLIDQHENELRARTQGIDFRRALSERAWPFPAFAKTLAQLLGRKGGLSAFSAAELETLRKHYTRNPSLAPPLLEEAVERAQERTLPYVIYELQNLSHAKEA